MFLTVQKAPMRRKRFQPEKTVSPTAGQPSIPLQQGMKASEVEKPQARFMELDYMEQDLTTDFFMPMTKHALELLQRKHNLKMDGIFTEEVKKLLFSDQAK